MSNCPEKIEINGEVYVRVGSAAAEASTVDGLPYRIVRTRSAGVFAGYLYKIKDQVATIRRARRLWDWAGAASLSQLAVDGVSKPEACKFPDEVSSIEVYEVIEVLPVTRKAQESIASVKPWRA